MYKLIVTHIRYPKEDGRFFLFTGLHNGKRFLEMQCHNEKSEFLLGNIYIGRVQNISQNLNAAFIDIGISVNGYLPLKDNRKYLFTHKNGKAALNIGDELLVQVTKNAIKTKPPVLSSNLNLTGSYAALTVNKTGIGVSSKIKGEIRNRLKECVQDMQHPEYGWVLRTNSANVEPSLLLQEMEQLKNIYEQRIKTAVHKTVFSRIYQNNDPVLDFIRHTNRSNLSGIVTDDPEIYRQLRNSFQNDEAFLPFVTLYEDDGYPLSKLYSIETELERALNRKVWLKSGAYLLIEPTEALTVIDVNSGKNTTKKRKNDYFLQVNLEAAREIANQLRLRNISGICVVDFIDLPKEKQPEFIQEFCRFLKEDPIPAVFVDLTALGLAELTRKKIYPSLHQQIYGK